MNLKQKVESLHKLRQQMEEMKRAEQIAIADILSEARDVIAEQMGKDYGTGTATLPVEGYKVKVTVSKKVTYEQDGLAAIRAQLAENGEDPDEYVKAKYDVAEAAYKGWPSSLKAMFEPYRTVEVSKPVIKIEV